jgi:hypothetical protein
MSNTKIEGFNLYFLYAYRLGGTKHALQTMAGETVPFFKDTWHRKHQVIYFWHSSGGKYVASDFEYLYRLRKEFEKDAEFWFVNLSGADRKKSENEEKSARIFAEKHKLELDSILLDKKEEAVGTFALTSFSTIAFVKKDNYVFRKLSGEFDEAMVRKSITDMIAARLHRDDD